MAEASTELESVLSRALEATEEGTPGGATRGFAGLSATQREDVLRRVERSHPEAFETLVRHAYDGVYSHPAKITRLGLEPGPVQPRGYRIEPAALPDLGRVVARGPIYRRASRVSANAYRLRTPLGRLIDRIGYVYYCTRTVG